MSKCIIDDTSFSPSNHCIPSNKFVSGTNLHKDKEQCNDALYTPRVKKKKNNWQLERMCSIPLKYLHARYQWSSLAQSKTELIDVTAPIHKVLIQNNNPVDINTWLDELEDDKFSNIGDDKHVPGEETDFTKALTKEHGTINSRYTFMMYFPVSRAWLWCDFRQRLLGFVLFLMLCFVIDGWW